MQCSRKVLFASCVILLRLLQVKLWTFVFGKIFKFSSQTEFGITFTGGKDHEYSWRDPQIWSSQWHMDNCGEDGNSKSVPFCDVTWWYIRPLLILLHLIHDQQLDHDYLILLYLNLPLICEYKRLYYQLCISFYWLCFNPSLDFCL